MSTTFRYAFAAGAIILFAGIVGTIDFEDEQRAELAYCAEVDAFKHTHGAEGHPAYDGEEFCTKYTREQLRAASR